MSFDLKNYSFSIGEHEGMEVILVHFSHDPYYPEVKDELKKKFPVVQWCASEKYWYLPNVYAIRKEVGLSPKTEPGKVVVSRIYPNNRAALKRMHELLILKGYSPNTIRTYCAEFAQLLDILKDIHVDSLTPERLRAYFLYCVGRLRLSENMIHSRMNAVKFYFQQVLGREKFFFEEIPRPNKYASLPKVFNKSEISKIFAKTDNLKHLVMIKLCYGMGLRVSEIVNLKITDIDSIRMLVHVQSAKGKRDRYVNLPSSILEELRNYFRAYRPKKYLFEGQFGGQYAVRSVQVAFKNAMQRARINKQVGIHGLRHSYATHLLECGTDMVFIQKLLGHKDIKTTEIYAKVSNRQLGRIKSPLDDM